MIRTQPDGRIALDGDQARIFAVVRCRGAAGSLTSPGPAASPAGAAPTISAAAVQSIVTCEVTSRAVYEQKWAHPIWPGLNSGVTIGIGYDLGQNSADRIRADWSGILDNQSVDKLVACADVFMPAFG